jgi:hypothetical protein
MLMGKFLAIAAALLLAAGCMAPVNGYYGGYGGYDGYYDGGYAGYNNYSAYGYGSSCPTPIYGSSYGYPGYNTSTVYKYNTVVIPQSTGYQQPAHYHGNRGAVVNNPQDPRWRRRQAQTQNYQRGPYHLGHQGNPANNSGQSSLGPAPGQASGPGFGNHAGTGPRHRYRNNQVSGPQTQPSFVRPGHRQHQAVNAPGLTAAPSHQGPRPQAMQASSPGPVMNRPMAQPSPRPAMSASRPTAGGPSGSPPRAPQGQGRQAHQKRGGQGSQ